MMCILLAVMLAGCSAPETSEGTGTSDTADMENNTEKEIVEMKMNISSTAVDVDWEDNESVAALRDLASEKPLTIRMSMYGGFEQVGSIGATLPSSDTNIKTKAGDIMLYTSSQMVIFYGSNSWAYTRLGRITDKSDSELRELLGGDGVTVTITAE